MGLRAAHLIPCPFCASSSRATGADARRHAAKELLWAFGGALDPVPVLREFFQSAKGADARRQTAKKLAGPLGGALDTAPVLREFFQRIRFLPRY